MADIETLDRSEHTFTAEGVNGVQEQSSVQGSPSKSSEDGRLILTKAESVSSEPSPASPSPGTGTLPLRGTTPNGATPGTSTVPNLSVPHPKKFSHININKKFLEKTSSVSSTSSTLSNTTAAKAGNSPQKPVVQPNASHSRLVTAKLTAGPQPSTLTGPGWSRPSSTGSTVTPTPASSTNPKPSPLLTPAPPHTAAASASVGKIIHPISRPAVEGSSSSKKENGHQLAWGGSKSGGKNNVGSVTNDFPTAAEVAQVRSAKLNEKKQAAQAAAAQKQAMAADADAFRGVHLGSGHHWDEDEGDDDNFLEGVIEFGDGRQYTIPTESRQNSPPQDVSGISTGGEMKRPESQQPVSKEDRFQDDFDRSWPRSRGPGPGGPTTQEQSHPHRPPSSASSQPLHSPQEGSRVLFNERSNRLEPYSSQSHRFPGARDSFPARREGRGDLSSSPTESRRDIPPHSARSVQLLQKSQEATVETSYRSRADGERPGFGSHNDRQRDRDSSRRDYGPPHTMRPMQPAGETRSRDHLNPLGLPHISPAGPRDTDRIRRLSTGPTSLPSPSNTDAVRDGRPLPPHLSVLQVPPAQRGPPSSATSEAPSSAHPATQSPAASFASISPRISDSPLHSSTIPLVDIDEVRKAAMHSAAERARLRRQQEEEERERERERARRKAAELEEKMKDKAPKEKSDSETNAPPKQPKETATEYQVLDIIKSAVQSVSQPPSGEVIGSVPDSAIAVSDEPQSRLPFVRASSTRGGLRSSPRRSSFPTLPFAPEAASSAADAESWRSKAGPLKPLQRPVTQVTSPVILALPPPPAFQAANSLTIEADEQVEVVDFSEHGKLVGQDTSLREDESAPSEAPVPGTFSSSRPSRPVAMDFFEDSSLRQQGMSEWTPEEESMWRRRVAVHEPNQPHTSTNEPHERPDLQINPAPYVNGPSHRRLSTASDDHQRSHVPYGHPRSPLTPSYREAPMSALDDTMARIRGAMGLRSKAEPPAPKQPPKWLPPALRARSTAHSDEYQSEVFDVTAMEPPRSPKPAWNHYLTKLPAISRPVDPLSKRQMHMTKTIPHVRSDIFSWDPPIDGMNRKDFHFNDILFHRLFVPKGGRPKYHVSLPRARSTDRQGKPIVNIPLRSPISAPASNGAFGKKKEADEASTWRKPVGPPKSHPVAEETETQGLDTTSRSPPPEAPSNAVVAPKSTADVATSPSISVVPLKSRTQPKMPQGSDVAFYRDSHSESVSTAGAAVKFIVSSELEEVSASLNGTTVVQRDIAHPNGDFGAPATSRVVMTESSHVDMSSQGSSLQSVSQMWPESKKIEAHSDVAPANPMSPWSSKSSPRVFSLKDSPSKPPDRDHLKAVWETTSNKADGAVNSLERIGDDMTAISFSILDVKSEAGTTPPPIHSNPPSRMSQRDVTRAFQQVPPSVAMANAPHRPTPAPSVPHSMPVMTSPPSRAPNHGMPPPQQLSGATRPMYPSYQSPLVSSPSPTVVYPMSMTPSPIPRPMVVNGTPQYSAPMWVPLAGPPGSTNGMMRPPPTPYGAQLMPYPPPSGMYASHSMQGGVPANGIQNRPPPNGMQMLSPIMQQAHVHPHPGAHPVYAQSPVLMHAPAATHPVGHVYANANQPPRGQMRGGYDHAPGMGPYPPAGPQSHAPTYAAVPSNSFDRPW